MVKRLLFLLPLYFICSFSFAYPQDMLSNDSIKKNNNFFKKIYEYFEKSNEVNHDKAFDVSFIGGPHYSGDTKLGLGLVASGLYRMDKNDLSISPSNVSLYGDITTSGSFAIGISGNTIFPEAKYRLDFDLYFSSMPSKFWGVGYKAGRNDEDYAEYTRQAMQLKVDFLRSIVQHAYIGITATAENIKGVSIKDWSYFEGIERSNTAVGAGLILTYDSRDFIPNPYKGIYIKLEQNFYPEFLGSSHNFSRTEFIGRYYRQMWKGAVIAFDFQGIFNNGNVPWSMVSQLGSSYQMRGYFKGQYRDKKLLQTQVELRQKIYGRSGAVLWAGAGNVFPKFSRFEWNQTLPSFGIGYRWEFKNRVNVRLDYGIGRGQSAFYFNINEAF